MKHIMRSSDISSDLGDNLKKAFPPRNPIVPTGNFKIDTTSIPVAAFLEKVLNQDFSGSPQFRNSRSH